MKISKSMVATCTVMGLTATSAFAQACPADYPGGNVNFLVG